MLSMPVTQTLQMPPQRQLTMGGASNSAFTKSLQQSSHGLSAQQMKKIDEASKDFESVYMTEMLKPMFDTVKTDAMFGGGKGEDTFKTLLLQQYGKKIAERDGLGLAKYVKAEMIQMQEKQK